MSPKSFPDSLTGPGKTAGLRGLSVCLSDGCLWWPVWACSSGKSKSWTSSLSLHHPPSACVTGPAQKQLLLPLPVSTALHHSPSKPLLVGVRVCVCVILCVWCGSLREAAEDLSIVIQSLSEANKQSMHDMSGMQRIPHGLFTENNPSKTSLTGSHRCNSDSKHTNTKTFLCAFSKLYPTCLSRFNSHTFTSLLPRAGKDIWCLHSKKHRQTAWGTWNSQHDDPWWSGILTVRILYYYFL